MILRARVILPLTTPPIEDGAIAITGNKIRSVAPFRDIRPHAREKILNLGDVASCS